MSLMSSEIHISLYTPFDIVMVMTTAYGFVNDTDIARKLPAFREDAEIPESLNVYTGPIQEMGYPNPKLAEIAIAASDAGATYVLVGKDEDRSNRDVAGDIGDMFNLDSFSTKYDTEPFVAAIVYMEGEEYMQRPIGKGFTEIELPHTHSATE
jgi:hypothetical protein